VDSEIKMPWTEVTARFNPKRLESLKPELKSAIGVVAKFRYAWTIDEDDGGPYVGQIAFLTDDERFQHLWIPTEDLEFLEDAQ
jgi:hypothetical protein